MIVFLVIFQIYGSCKMRLKFSNPTHVLPKTPLAAEKSSNAITIAPTGPILNRISSRKPGIIRRYS